MISCVSQDDDILQTYTIRLNHPIKEHSKKDDDILQTYTIRLNHPIKEHSKKDTCGLLRDVNSDNSCIQ